MTDDVHNTAPTASEREYDLGLKARDRLPGSIDPARLLPPARLLRLHPHWFVGPVVSKGSHHSTHIRDYATDREFDVSFSLIFHGRETIDLEFDTGPLTRLRVERSAKGWRGLAGFNGRPTEEAERDAQLWLRGMREYIRLYLSANPLNLFFRMLMNRVILRMNPSQRKITVMIWKITVVEVAVIILIIVAYFLFIQPLGL